ncbi:MAG: hypothetical protein M3M87_01340 [Thermoproteota archaeon]|nr:hypothetical protein [Thermoproteota archaeon]
MATATAFDLENVSYIRGGFSVIAGVLAAIVGISLLFFWRGLDLCK